MRNTKGGGVISIQSLYKQPAIMRNRNASNISNDKFEDLGVGAQSIKSSNQDLTKVLDQSREFTKQVDITEINIDKNEIELTEPGSATIRQTRVVVEENKKQQQRIEEVKQDVQQALETIDKVVENSVTLSEKNLNDFDKNQKSMRSSTKSHATGQSTSVNSTATNPFNAKDPKVNPQGNIEDIAIIRETLAELDDEDLGVLDLEKENFKNTTQLLKDDNSSRASNASNSNNNFNTYLSKGAVSPQLGSLAEVEAINEASRE